MNIVKFPDERLALPCTPIRKITDEIRDLASGMIELMYKLDGVGLAAPQVGVSKKIFVYDLSDGRGPQVVLNPKVTTSKDTWENAEGCLSVPGTFFRISRSCSIEIQGVTLEGYQFKETVKDFKARVFQHEYDHLCGKLIINRLNPQEMADFLNKKSI